MKVRIIAITEGFDTEIFAFATEKYLFNILKDKVKEWVDEETDEGQQEVIREIEDLTTYDELCGYANEKFDVIIKVEEYEVVE